MTSFILNEVINDGEKIILMDGSIWQINPVDIPTVCTWIPTAEIDVSASDDTVFDHTLTNKNIGVSVMAIRLK
jgi:hypothetical protein